MWKYAIAVLLVMTPVMAEVSGGPPTGTSYNSPPLKGGVSNQVPPAPGQVGGVNNPTTPSHSDGVDYYAPPSYGYSYSYPDGVWVNPNENCRPVVRLNGVLLWAGKCGAVPAPVVEQK